MDAWILLAVAAAAFQTLRFLLQKRLSMGRLSIGGATFSRFIYSAPVIVGLAAGYLAWTGAALPGFTVAFWAYAAAGGLAQILATWCVVALFSERNFAVGITFKKTEVLLTALVGFIVLGDRITAMGAGAILTGFLGVLLLSRRPDAAAGRGAGGLLNRGAGLGLLSGVFFAVSAVGYRGATLEIPSDDPLLRACLALAAVTLGQTLGMGLWLRWREPGQIARVVAAWRTAAWIGLAGMAGSLCWFTAFTLQNAAYVFAVGQIEVIFSLAAGALAFRERVAPRELFGIALLTVGILWLVAAG